MFCPKCGSILLPKSEGKKNILVCSCGYKLKKPDIRLREITGKKEKIDIVDKEETTHLPSINEDCPKCGHNKAVYWLVQTRAGDEPETKFLKCEKCGHTWRDYS